jgi:hypothetical protein
MSFLWLNRGVRASVAGVVLAGACVLAVPGTAGAAEALPSGHNFGALPAAQYLSCTGSAKIAGKFSLNITGVTGKFAKWTTKDRKQAFTASLSLTTTISASVDVSANTTCTPSKKLKSLAAASFPVGVVVVKVRPDFYLNISAAGKITASRAITQSVTLTGKLGVSVNRPTYSISRGDPAITASGSADFTAVIGADAEILAGALDLDFALMAGVEATAQASPGQVCVTGYPALRASVTVGAAFFAWTPSAPLLKPTTWEITSILGHSTRFRLCAYTPPKIITTLPTGTVGQHYSAALTTADHRTGTWQELSVLPPGLSLSGHTVSGTPATAGAYSFKVRFTDARHTTATATVTLTVKEPPTWTAVEAKLPSDWPAGAKPAPVAVSCPSAAFCAAIGTDLGPDNAIWFRKAGAWTTAQRVPPPPDVAAPGGGPGAWVRLTGVSCPSVSLCVVVGYYYSSSSGIDTVPLVMTWNNGSWKQGSLLYGAGGNTVLAGVSCPTTSYCVAVGTNTNSSAQTGLVATWTGGVWAVSDAAEPANGLPSQSSQSILAAVSCASAAFCVAAGTYEDTSFNEDVMLLTISGGVQSATQAPLPAVAGVTPDLRGVSCPSASSCVVVGGGSTAFVLTLAGGKWTLSAEPDLLYGVSCWSPSACVAVGGYNSNLATHGLLLTLSGGKWTPSQAPSPPNAAGYATLMAVSCWAPSSCAAAGFYEDTSGVLYTGMLLTLSS